MNAPNPRLLHVERHSVRTADGWTLTLHRGVRRGQPPGKPVLFVPGFGMNAYIFRYHPSGTSMMEAMAAHGLDPWSVDLRGQRSSRAPSRRTGQPGLDDHVFGDLPAAFEYIAQHTGIEKIHAIGCSLGGALLYGYGALEGSDRLDRLVTMGTPLRWRRPSWLVRGFSVVGPLSARLPVRGTRHLARAGLPIAARIAPGPLSIYLNPKLTQTSDAKSLTRTVENPIPRTNRQLAKWIASGDLRIGGANLTEALDRFERPLLVVAGNGDQICDAASALAALDAVRGPARSLVVGTPQERVSHADLFIADLAPERIFAPVASFLTE
ncbi:MAG: alpha/beta fold hydrolase [Deltaproteobacteria bacterium]|nr:MAG: alpha/beta fold hydrolase [Deltaproteobacteria bacterium]